MAIQSPAGGSVNLGAYADECIARLIAEAPPPTPELIADLRIIIHGSAARPLNERLNAA